MNKEIDAKVIEKIKNSIRTIPDFPKKGILFRDITTALKDKEILRLIIDETYNVFKDEKIDYVAGIESRGFIFGMPLAYKLDCGFIPIRKPNKLPAEVLSEEYDLEYGKDKIEMHKDALNEGDRVLIVDDLLATGGTARAAYNLITKAKGKVIAMAFLIELDALKGREILEQNTKTNTKANTEIFSLIQY